MRLGIITSSYGRLLGFLSAILYIQSEDNLIEPLNIPTFRRNLWIFPDEHRYPYIGSLLRERINILPSYFIWLYRIVTKFKWLSNLFVISQDSFNLHQSLAWSNNFSMLDELGQINPTQELLRFLEEAQVNLEHYVVLHTRDSSWYQTLGISQAYVNREDYRNSNMDDFREIAKILLSRGYSVIRTGRSDSPLFDKEIKGYFDYASSSFSNDQDDFFLWQKTKWAVSTLNGGSNLGLLFKKRMLIWDYPEPTSHLANAIPFYPPNHVFLLQRRHGSLAESKEKFASLEEVADIFESSEYLSETFRNFNLLSKSTIWYR
jgi:putative glycosyltransferase (TIGR04372 family)